MSDERAVRIAFAGDLDMYRRDEVTAALPQPGSIDRLVIDLREVTILDSTILSQFMRYRRTFIETGKDPHEIIVVVKPQLRRIFEITGLIKSLTVVSAASEVETTDTFAAEPLSEA